MREPGFWWRPPQDPGPIARLLSPLALIYTAVSRARLRGTPIQAECPVICVGNFSLGGTGKTPAVIALARMLIADGEAPAILSRGYGGRLVGPVRVDLAQHTAADVGDEPLLLAQAAITVVAKDRVAGAALAKTLGATVIILDDGMQNPALAKDYVIAVVDRRGIGNGRVFPAGPLRAPFPDQLPLIDALLVSESGPAATSVVTAATAGGAQVFHATLIPDTSAVAALRGRQYLAFAGIGSPDKFFRTLDGVGIDAPVRRGFPDHHRYTRADAVRLIAEARATGLSLLTTQKDLARMAGDADVAALAGQTSTLPVTIELNEAGELHGRLRDMLARKRRAG